MEVRNVSYAYADKRRIFENVSFSIEMGDLFTILGPNGAGKSTLLNCISNLAPLTDGKILLEGTDISRMSPSSIARKIAYVPQNFQPAYGYSVRDYIVMGRAPHMGMFSTPKDKDYELAHKIIETMNLTKFADKAVTEISGGELQQACIARAIVQNPAIILFDEPTSALDYGNQLRTLRMLKKIIPGRIRHYYDHP